MWSKGDSGRIECWRERAKEERGREKKRNRGADSMGQRGEGYGRHSETVERGTDERTDRRTDEWTGRAGERSEGEREREKETTGWGSSQTPRGKLSNYTGGSASRPPSSSPSAAPMIKTHHGFSATKRERARARTRVLPDALPGGDTSGALSRTRRRDFRRAYHGKKEKQRETER